jgi:flagellar hook assembly protein FlgD
MQEHRKRSTSTSTRQRNINRGERTPNVMFTALTIGAVILLLAVTFAVDWLRTPEINITGSPQFFSPNQDNSFDIATINYQLSESAEVNAQIVNEGGSTVRSLINAQTQPAGQHFLVWNGIDESGQRVTDGTYRVEISARGSVRASSAGAVLRVDTTPPTLELLNLQDGTRVRDNLLTIEGLTDPGASIWLENSAQAVPVDGQGRFRTQQKLAEGVNQVKVSAADQAGNTATALRLIELVTAPPQVVINSPTEGAWINNPKVTIEGQAPTGVVLKINNQTIPVAPDGSFRYDLLLNEGDQTIQMTATDDVGNVTTVERTVHVKTSGPRLEVNIIDGASFSDPALQLTGVTSPGAVVLVNQREIGVGTLGDFQTTVSLLEGDNLIDVTARDQAGNTTNLTRRVRFAVPTDPSGLDLLARNLGVLPAITIPAVLLLSLLLGFFLYRQNQLDVQLSVDTQNFIPGLPQEGKNLTLRLDLNQPARITLEVLDENGEAQATLLDNRRRTARQHIFLWDGYDDFGQPVVSGVYTIRATAGAPPIKVSSAVQVQVEQDPYVLRKSQQFEKEQMLGQQQVLPRRRVRQNRKRI